ncbi:hypothetical protein RJT34_20207 [Clitoria ternatea]|uniref:Dirigent protein n=1 Tax=Clitoria ternatea TaxID=43366 RepID=A0AAN9ISM9_CLITE
MAIPKTLIFSTCLIPLTFLLSHLTMANPSSYSRRISPTTLGFHEEKLTHLHFYFHDVVTGPKPTMLIVAEPLKGKSDIPLPFGTTVAIEDPLTQGPEAHSKVVGKAQGLYTSGAHEAMELMMVMTFAFTEGEFNGSTLSVMGRNMIEHPLREMPVVGGTGAFRFARGYAQTKFVSVDFVKGDAVVEYDVYVFHYLTHDSAAPQSFHDGLEFMVDPILGKMSIN